MSSASQKEELPRTPGGLYSFVSARHGAFLANPKDSYIGQALIRYGEYSEAECRLLCSLLPRAGVVADVGANVGAFTVPLAKRAGREGRVHAFEPQPMVFQNLCANLALNGLRNVYAYNAACGAEEGSIVFPDIDYGVETNFGGVSLDRLPKVAQGQNVGIRTIDELDLPRLDLLKIDAEGMEVEVLKGATATIARTKPLLYLENDRLERSEELIALVQSLAYRLWWHLPPLYSADNWFQEAENEWPGIVSINMLCLPRDRSAEVSGLAEIASAQERPALGGRSG